MSVKNKQKLITLIAALMLAALVFICSLPASDVGSHIYALANTDDAFSSLVAEQYGAAVDKANDLRFLTLLNGNPRSALMNGLAAQAHSGDKNASYTPYYYETYIIAVKNIPETQAISGWESLRSSGIEAAFPDTSGGRLMKAAASISVGLYGSAYEYGEACAYLKQLKKAVLFTFIPILQKPLITATLP